MAHRACAFCPDLAATSCEHIFDDWLNRVAGKRVRQQYHWRETGLGGVETRRYTSTQINITRPVVCPPCNHGWMSELTNQTKQTLEAAIRHGSPVTFIELGISTIAAFTFMKAVVLDHVLVHQKSNHRPFFRPSARSRFRTDLELPAGVQIWIAPFRGSDAQSGHTWHHTKLLHSGEFAGFQFYVFTYMVGHVALQMTFPRWTKPTRFRGDLPMLTPHEAWDGTALQVWPYVGPLTWPYRGYLDDKALKDFRDRFNVMHGRRRASR